METEPISLVGESVSEASRDVPVLPNGSSMTSIKNEVQSDKLTSEKLQEIEDEEILDKMVLYFSCCYIQISTTTKMIKDVL